VIALIFAHLHARIAEARAIRRARPDEGLTLEYVVLVGLVVALAIAVVGILAARLMAKARNIDLGAGG